MTMTEMDVGAQVGSARRLVDAATGVIDAALASAASMTDGGRRIDDHQVHTERVAYLATQVRAAHELTAYAERLAAAGIPDARQVTMAYAYAAEVAHVLGSAIDAAWESFGLAEVDLESLRAPELRNFCVSSDSRLSPLSA